MTKEAMIKVLRYKAEHIKAKIRPEFFAEVADTLERQPCEDAISRADAVRVASGYCHPQNIAKELAKLPPVTPQQKMGRWIAEINDYGEVMGWHCDKCYEDSGFTTTCKWDFCPNCGARMIEPQESEG